MVWFSLLPREIQGMVTVGNILAQMVKNKVKPSDPISKIMYKQFKMVRVHTCLDWYTYYMGGIF